MKKLLIALAAITLLASCQKEISFDPNNPAGVGSGSGGTGTGGTTTGNTNGDLLVKALEISPATNDTNVITLQWDAAKRLQSYVSTGKVQGIVTNISDIITRASDGKIKTIVSKSTLPGSGTDSTVYTYSYVSGSTKVDYILSTRATILGDLNDSAAISYDASGRIASKEVFTDLFSGSWDPSAKEVYTYDAAGNVVKISNYSANSSGGYDLSGETVNSFDSHKGPLMLGEESFAVLGVSNTSKNNGIKVISNAVASGTTYTGVYSQLQYNSFDRPSQALLSVTPQPPGYSVKLLYYYK